MRVEIVSPTKQYFNGAHYWKGKNERYYRNAHYKPHSLHRAVWEYHNGKIPEGMVIDHIDRNTDNNQIENLRCVTLSENARNISSEAKAQKKAHCDKIRSLTKSWHASPEGLEWHRQHGIKAYAKRKPIERVCSICGKKFMTTQYSERVHLCSPSCQQKDLRRRRKLDTHFDIMS